MSRIDNPFSENNYGNHGDTGNIEASGNSGNIGAVCEISGYSEII